MALMVGNASVGDGGMLSSELWGTVSTGDVAGTEVKGGSVA